MPKKIIELLKGIAAGQTASRGLGSDRHDSFKLAVATQNILSQDLSRLVAREGEYLLAGNDPVKGLVVHSTRCEWQVPVFANTFEVVDQDLKAPEKNYEIFLANCGNPDFGEDPEAALPETRSGYWVPVKDAREASEIARQYIDANDLGGGNWSGGSVRTAILKRTVAHVSYNGRVWEVNEDKGDPAPARSWRDDAEETTRLKQSF